MVEGKNLRCQIYCQKGRKIDAEFPVNTGIYEEEGLHLELTEKVVDGCQFGEIRLNIKNEACTENDNLRVEKPIRVYLPIKEQPEKITAMYLYNEWWTRPAFVTKFQDIPEYTQVAFFKYKDRFSCLVPMVGRKFKTYLVNGTETEICLEMTAWLGGLKDVEEPLYIMAEASVLAEAIYKAFSWLAEYKGIRMREGRRIPEMFRYLGWCSWDAFYRDITEDKVRQKANELLEKKVPVKWMLIDDGWLSVQDELLCDFAPDKEKFPAGFKKMIKEIKEKGEIRWFGVWHALGGYWGGVAPGSELEFKENAYLYKTVNGKLIPSPQTGEQFYRNWYQNLRREEIDFVKVDGQSAVPYYFENSLPVSEAARGINQALEGGASNMDGAIINCMGMAMENILARPTSAISRNSDDFVPDKEGGFAEHLLQNAYNALYHNELYCCDWDMFWTMHEDCVKHSLLRAISGGPIYVSDKIGATNPDVLKPLVYGDGRILMMDRSAKPTVDCVFSDPMADGVLKLHNVASWGNCGKGGGIAVYNLTDRKQSFTFRPTDIPDLEVADRYWVYDYFEKKAFSLDRNEKYEGSVARDGFGWFVLLPQGKNCSCLGLMNKYVGFMAVESIHENDKADIMVIRESGPVGWLSEKEPQKVMVNAVEVTENVKKEDKLYTISFAESSDKMILSIVW
ncbi:Sip1-related alpha-galactosidase [Roseburia hominis]